MRSPALAWFLLGSASIASAQEVLLTTGLPSAGRKAVVHDLGSLWHAALLRLNDGSVVGIGNPWLGGGITALSLNANDLARNDAFTRGEAESVSLVDNDGMKIVRWDDTLGYTVTAATDTGSANGNYIRSAPFPAPQHTIALVAQGSGTVRVFRDTTLVATPTITGAARDLEIFQHASGAALLIVRNDTSATCLQLNGTTVWTLNYYDGDIVRWPQPSNIRAAWINRPTQYGNWRLTLLGDGGAISSVPLASLIANTVQVFAAFAKDADNDGDIDLVVKTSAGTSILVDTSITTPFNSVQKVDLPTAGANATSTPDVLSTDGGRRLRLVDVQSNNDVAWSRIDLPLGQPDESNGLSFDLIEPPFGGLVSNEADTANPPQEHTKLEFGVKTSLQAMQDYGTGGQEASVQVVSWRQVGSSDPARQIQEAEHNWRYPLAIPTNVQTDLTWNVSMTLLPELVWFQHEELPGQNGWDGDDKDTLYWLTVRLCSKPVTGSTITAASEPITLVMSMASLQFEQSTPWGYIKEYIDGPLAPLDWGPVDGGGIVGGIQKVSRPPPQLPGMPLPRAATPMGTIHQPGQ